MTKITVIGEAPKEEKKLKPIELVGCINYSGMQITKAKSMPSDFEEITVIKVKEHEFDCICICVNKSGEEFIYTANFNDGVAE